MHNPAASLHVGPHRSNMPRPTCDASSQELDDWHACRSPPRLFSYTFFPKSRGVPHSRSLLRLFFLPGNKTWWSAQSVEVCLLWAIYAPIDLRAAALGLDDTLVANGARFRSHSSASLTGASLPHCGTRPHYAEGHVGRCPSRLSRQHSCAGDVVVAGQLGVAAARRGRSRPSCPGAKHSATGNALCATDAATARVPSERTAACVDTYAPGPSHSSYGLRVSAPCVVGCKGCIGCIGCACVCSYRRSRPATRATRAGWPRVSSPTRSQ